MKFRAAAVVVSLIVGVASAMADDTAAAPKRLLLLGQKPDGHPAGTHEYLPGQRILAKLLAKTPGLETTIVNADEPWSEGPELLKKADGVVIFVSEGAKWLNADPRRYDAFASLAQRGGGFSALHWGTGTKKAANIEPYVRLLGACHGGPDRKYTFAEFDVTLCDPQHPISTGLANFHVREEFYYRLKQVQPLGSIHPLVQVPIEGETQTVCWAWERPDGGRAFGYTGLHYHDNWQKPEYRRLIAQGVLWSMKLPVPAGGLNVDIPADELAP